MIILKKIEKRWVDISLDKYLTQNIYQFKEIAIALTFVGGYVDAIPFRTRWNFSSWTNGEYHLLASEVSHHNLNGGL